MKRDILFKNALILNYICFTREDLKFRRKRNKKAGGEKKVFFPVPLTDAIHLEP